MNPDFRAVYAARARVRYVRGNQPGGRDDFDRYLALTRGPALKLQGAAACRLRGHFVRVILVELPAQYRKLIGPWALEELQKAFKLGDRSSALFQDIGAVYETLGWVDLAIDAYTRALVPAPGDVKTLVMRARAHALKNQFDRAEDDFRSAIRLEPDHPDAHAGLGFVRATLKASDDAQREALQAIFLIDKIEYSSNDIVIHSVACTCAVLAQTDPGRATEYQNQAIDLLGRALELWKLRGSGPSEIQYIKGESAFDP